MSTYKLNRKGLKGSLLSKEINVDEGDVKIINQKLYYCAGFVPKKIELEKFLMNQFGIL